MVGKKVDVAETDVKSPSQQRRAWRITVCLKHTWRVGKTVERTGEVHDDGASGEENGGCLGKERREGGLEKVKWGA